MGSLSPLVSSRSSEPVYDLLWNLYLLLKVLSCLFFFSDDYTVLVESLSLVGGSGSLFCGLNKYSHCDFIIFFWEILISFFYSWRYLSVGPRGRCHFTQSVTSLFIWFSPSSHHHDPLFIWLLLISLFIKPGLRASVPVTARSEAHC